MRAKDIFWGLLYDIFRLLFVVALYVLVPILIIGGVIFVAEKTDPENVHVFNAKLTTSLVENLVDNGNYHAAIYIMESNAGFLESGSRRKRVENMCVLTDCYIHVGEYDKAEQILLKADTLRSLDDFRANIYNFNVSCRLAQIYNTIGNESQAVFYSEVMRRSVLYLVDHPKELEEYFGGKYSAEKFLSSAISMGVDVFERYGLDVAREMAENALLEDKAMNPSIKMHLLNKLVSISLREGDTISVAPYVHYAAKLAQSVSYMSVGDYSDMGCLSDYCYLLHDEMYGEYFLREYMKYLNERYDKEDLEYLLNSMCGFRLLKEKQDWRGLESAIENCCVGARGNIEKNFRGMTEEEREHFAKLLEEPYDYALNYLYEHSDSRKIANLCFDNNMFQQGLYLRSEMAIENAVRALNDEGLTKKYKRMVNCKRELDARRYVSGLGNMRVIRELEKEITTLDNEVSNRCWEYQYRNFEKHPTRDVLLERLGDDEAVLQFAETQHGQLYCLVLKKGGNSSNVSFVRIASKEEIERFLQGTPDVVYHNTELTSMVFNNVNSLLKGVKKVYYTTSGVFNSVCIPALSCGSDRYLCDLFDFKLVSNCQKIIELKKGGKTSSDGGFCLWGAIEYTYGDHVMPREDAYRAIGCHQPLAYLGSGEIDTISSILQNGNVSNVKKWTSSQATERSFKWLDGRGVRFLHIDSHGYFDNSIDPSQAMHNSVLFFAGANRYWTNDTLKPPISGEDGILHADEISHMNLNGCELVVLSACETGIGYNGSSEGVYGLQRGFKLAGVNKIMMSLWKVGNQKAEEMMGLFYGELCKNGFDIENAFTYARNTMRRKYPHNPEYWAAFVLMD